jgi:hypothetical protein
MNAQLASRKELQEDEAHSRADESNLEELSSTAGQGHAKHKIDGAVRKEPRTCFAASTSACLASILRGW